MKLNLSTEALARSSAAHPWRTIAVWAVVLGVAGVLIFTLLEDALTTDFAFTNNPESWRADKLLEESLRGPRKVNEVLLVRSERLTVGDQAFRDRVKELYGAVMGLGSDVIAGGVSYYETGLESLVSADRRTTIVPLQMAGDFDQATDDVKLVMDIAREANGRDGFEVLIVGSASIAVESNEVAESDLRRGVGFGVPVALIILVLVFGALLVPFIPLVLAVFSIVVALGATALIGQAFELSFFVTNMIEMIGLAVGIDYSMFIVFRYREERSRGLEKMEAIARAGATASRAVFFSGMTVVLALVGMLIIPTTIFQSLGTGAILVVIAISDGVPNSPSGGPWSDRRSRQRNSCAGLWEPPG